MTHAVINLPELQWLARELEKAREAHKTAQRLVDALTNPADATTVMLTLTVKNDDRHSREEAVSFAVPLTEAPPYSKARAVEANRPMLLAARRHAQERLIGWSSKVEGLEFQIRRLVKGDSHA